MSGMTNGRQNQIVQPKLKKKSSSARAPFTAIQITVTPVSITRSKPTQAPWDTCGNSSFRPQRSTL